MAALALATVGLGGCEGNAPGDGGDNNNLNANGSQCGNGVIEPGEECDGIALDGNDCESIGPGFVGGVLACAGDCRLDDSGCVGAECGNGTVEGVEACDGSELDGADCASLGFGGGTLRCSATCEHDTLECYPAGFCMDNAECPSESDYCEKADGDCPGLGQCAPRTTVCDTMYIPACGCDGQTYSHPCEAARVGVNVDYLGVCGGICYSNPDCPLVNEYCQKTFGDCDGVGQCESNQVTCDTIYWPVCGCDGLSYPNECNAVQVGVNADYPGVCDGICDINADCAPMGGYCAKADGDCSGFGLCTAFPGPCSPVIDQVCGCDGQTYDNACTAGDNGISVAYAGPC